MRLLSRPITVCGTVLFVSLSLAFTACSKPQSASIIDNPLLTRIPAEPTMVYAWSSTTSAYQQFKESAWYKTSASSNSQMLQLALADQKLGPILASLKKSGLVAEDLSFASTVNDAVVVARAANSKVPELSLLLGAASNTDMREKLSAVESVLRDQGIEPTVETFDSVTGISFELKDEELPEAVRRVFIAADNKVMVCSNSRAALSQAFAPPSSKNFDALKSSSRFSDAFANTDWNKAVNFFYADVRSFFAEVSNTLPAEIRAEAKPEQIPVQSVGFVFEVNDGLRGHLRLAMDAKSNEQAQLLRTLSTAQGQHLYAMVPSNAVASLSLDAKMLAQLRDGIAASMPKNEAAAMLKQLGFLSQMASTALSIMPNSAASPFPEITLVVQTSESAALLEQLKSHVGALIGGFTGGAPRWSDKEIGGVKAQYILTPLGIGVFFASQDDKIIVASSEASTQQSLALASSGSQSLASTMSSALRSELRGKGAGVILYVSMNKAAELYDAVQGSMSMFSGSELPADRTSIEQMRKMGSFLVSISGSEKTISVDSVYE